MGRFAGLADVRTNQSGLYFLDGNYVVEIQGFKYFTSRAGAPTFAIEGKVINSTNLQRGVGCKPSQVITVKQEFYKTCMSNVKQFVAECLGLKNPEHPGLTDALWDEVMEFCVDEEANPLKGVVTGLVVTTIETKVKKSSFSKHVWGPVTSTPEIVQSFAEAIEARLQ